MSSKFIIENAIVNQVQTMTSKNGNPYYKIHFNCEVAGKNGQMFSKTTQLVIFDAQKAQQIQSGGTYNMIGVVDVNQQGYPQLKLVDVQPAGQSNPNNMQSHPQQNNHQPPQNQGQQYGSMPQNPNVQPQQNQGVQQNNGFNDNIPF